MISCKKTIKQYAGHVGFLQTADFLEIILSWWKLMNVKSTFKGIQKRDPQRDAITLENLVEKTSFLRAFVQWMSDWQEISSEDNSGLSKETFQAAKHSSESIASLAEYLLQKQKFKYFLPGKCQSDKLEGQFGQLRQMTGGNMFGSVRQFLESDRTLKIKKMAKLELTPVEIKEIFSESKSELQEKVLEFSQQIFSIISIDTDIRLFPEVPDVDKNALFYVSGCFTMQIANSVKCPSCKELILSCLVLSEDDSLIVDQKQDTFLSQVNRGGLTTPSELMFLSTAQSWHFYSLIMKNPSCSKLLHSPNVSSRNIFVEALVQFIGSSEETRLNFVEQQCDYGHCFEKVFRVVAKKCFNMFSKNYIAAINSEIHANRKRTQTSETKRESSISKAAKLQSESF